MKTISLLIGVIALSTVMAAQTMIHAGTIKRFRKRWLISRAADDRPTVPLDQFSGLRVSRT